MLRKLILHLHFTKSLKRDNMLKNLFTDSRRTHLPSAGKLASFEAEMWSACVLIINILHGAESFKLDSIDTVLIQY